MSYRPEWDDSSGGGASMFPKFRGTAVGVIVTICVVSFLVMAICDSYFRDFTLLTWLQVSTDNLVFVYPFFTYEFVHSTTNPSHVLINCLVIYFFGSMVEQAIGRSRFLGLFFLAGVAGGLAHFLVFSLLLRHPQAALYGASGSALSLLFYAAWAWPKAPAVFFIFRMPLRVLAWILFSFDALPILLRWDDQVSHICHLAGAGVGVLYYKKGLDPLAFFRSWQETRRFRVREQARNREREDDAESDRILEKIGREGIGSLTKQERKFLDARSKSLREGRGR